MTSRQLNIRLGTKDRDLLEAVAFVRRQPAATLAREILCEYLARHQDDASVRMALAALEKHGMERRGPARLRHLPTRD